MQRTNKFLPALLVLLIGGPASSLFRFSLFQSAIELLATLLAQGALLGDLTPRSRLVDDAKYRLRFRVRQQDAAHRLEGHWAASQNAACISVRVCVLATG